MSCEYSGLYLPECTCFCCQFRAEMKDMEDRLAREALDGATGRTPTEEE